MHLKGLGPYLIFGDVHGCLSELKELFRRVYKDFPEFTAITVGDLVDRGPDSGGVVDFCIEKDVIGTLGNHEEKLLRAKKGNPVQLKKHHQVSFNELNKDEKRWDYLSKMSPLVRIRDHNVIVVHGGLFPNIKPEHQNLKHIIRLRNYDPETRRLYRPNEQGGTPWIDKWYGPEYVIYGHIHRDEVETRKYSLGLDTGVVYGNKLTGVVLSKDKGGSQNVQFYQVDSEETYWTDSYEDEMRKQ